MKRGTGRLGRDAAERRALLRSLSTAFFVAEKIETTEAKAKVLRPVVEKLITLGKNDTLSARRRAASYLLDEVAVEKLFTEIAPRYKDRPGGYTRIVKTGVRRGDATPLAIIELV
ncbi:MAG: 50S ribosomal protein L17 [Bacillota bacterium]|nr:50S ribosomal protein L17 [Bacillota bacterium]NLU54670.1 50S ribosomal protein L17 [Bacillota bacterium]HOA90489.1 50S ribosomal protein L17 [Bacillota bacterium]HOJ46310.1 50S ribosomal protein L17 [Bacillota bacterium]HOL14217.1 50S ribosomal protein L17 [Bacillota bacterium]